MRKKYDIALDETKEWFLRELQVGSLLECETEQERNSALSTVKNARNFMYKIQAYENQRIDKKPVYDLPKREFLIFLELLGCPSQECLSTYLTILKQYRQFANIHGLSSTNIDYIYKIKFGELYKYLDQTKVNNRYLTRKEAIQFTSTIDSWQDKALFMLIFEGINGARNKSLVELRKTDVDFTNSLIKTVDFTRKASKELLQILEKAPLEKDYGTAYQTLRNLSENCGTILVDSDYVLRPTCGYVKQTNRPKDPDYPTYSGEHVLSKTISGRFYRFTKEDERMQHVTITTLYNSGIIDRAIKKLGKYCDRKSFVDHCVVNEKISEGTGYKLFAVWIENIYPKLHPETRHPLDARPVNEDIYFEQPV